MLLISSTIHLFLIPGWVAEVCIHVLVVEPWTIARLPLQSAYHTEFCGAPTRHMVAAFLELYHGRAIIALLPPLLLGSLNELLRRWIIWTVS